MKKSEGEDRGSRDGGGTSSSGSKRRRADTYDESKEVEMDDANDTTNQQQEGKEEGVEESLQLGTKTHDGGSSSQVAEEDTNTEETEVNNNTMDAFARYSDGTTRRTRVSTEQHISTFLDGNNYQDEQ